MFAFIIFLTFCSAIGLTFNLRERYTLEFSDSLDIWYATPYTSILKLLCNLVHEAVVVTALVGHEAVIITTLVG